MNDRVIRDRATVRRLARLAVPPAYQDVLYARDASAHLQAIGRDAAGRLQYRYHPRWDDVRELRKARRLARLTDVLPRIHKSIGRYLAAAEESREFTCGGVELVARSSRPEAGYVRLHGTRGGMLVNVDIYGDTLTLRFQSRAADRRQSSMRRGPARSRGCNNCRDAAFSALGEGDVRSVTAPRCSCVNRGREDLAGLPTLLASAVCSTLARDTAASERKRRKQVLEAVRAATDDLANRGDLPDYVHDTVIAAFEEGVLEQFSKPSNDAARRPAAQVLAKISRPSADLARSASPG